MTPEWIKLPQHKDPGDMEQQACQPGVSAETEGAEGWVTLGDPSPDYLNLTPASPSLESTESDSGRPAVASRFPGFTCTLCANPS